MSYQPFSARRGRPRAFGTGQRRYRDGVDRAEVRGFVAALAGQDFYRNRATFRDLKKCSTKPLPYRYKTGATRSRDRTRAKSQTFITIDVFHGLTFFFSVLSIRFRFVRDLFFFLLQTSSLSPFSCLYLIPVYLLWSSKL